MILVRERAGRRGIVLHQVIEERLGEIRGDERKVKQVLLNLLSNALKFTPEGGRIDVRAGMVDGLCPHALWELLAERRHVLERQLAKQLVEQGDASRRRPRSA